MYAHCVWAVKKRAHLIPGEHREEVHKLITEIIKRRGQKLICIFCMPNHIHLLVGFRPSICISDVIRDVKRETSTFISSKKWTPLKFEWQEGFGCFTCSHSDLDRVCSYIQNQEEHHKKRGFEDEYQLFIKKHDIDYDDQYLFD